MERQAGLGRSLEQVLDSLTPADHEPQAPGRVLFEPEDLEQQLDQLMGDIRDLRERVQHLVGLIPNRIVLEPVRPVAVEPPSPDAPSSTAPSSISTVDLETTKKKGKKKKKSKTKGKTKQHEQKDQPALPRLRGVSGG